MLRTLLRVATIAVVCSVAFAVPASAAPEKIPAGGGAVGLPMSGLSVTLPAQGQKTYAVGGRWSLTDNEANYNARDVIDEFDAGGALTGGTWVQLGYFNAGGPEEIIEKFELIDPWSDKIALWDQQWVVRGGNYEFEGPLGSKPAAAISISRGANAPSLLLYVFFVDATGPMTKDDIIGRLADAATAHAVFDAYWTNRLAPSRPAKAENVQQPSDMTAARTVHLPVFDADLDLPDDGFIWMVEKYPGKDATADFLSLMGPALPDMALEVIVTNAASVQEMYGIFDKDKLRWDSAPANIPDGWERGATLLLPEGEEVTICKEFGDHMLFLGFLSDKPPTDLTPFAPIAAALAEAAE